VIAAAVLRQPHTVITTGKAWNPAIARPDTAPTSHAETDNGRGNQAKA
jgi:hypothetical protein